MKLEATPTDPILIQCQCDELGPVLAVGGDGIDSAGATGAPVVFNDQVQATRVAPDRGLMHRRPTRRCWKILVIQFASQAL